MAGPDSPPQPAFTERLLRLQQQWNAAGAACKGVACWDEAGTNTVPFPEGIPEISDAWQTVCTRVRQEGQLVLQQAGPATVVGCPLPMQPGRLIIVGVILGPPLSERVLALIQFGLGWIRSMLVEERADSAATAGALVEIQAHALSQQEARSGAQEWVNRLAQLVRAYAPDRPSPTLSYFLVRNDEPRWRVTSDTAWVEKASGPRNEAMEAAAEAILEMRECQTAEGWALPVLAQGRVVATVVAQGEALDEPMKRLIAASAQLTVPALIHWERSEQRFRTYVAESIARLVEEVRRPGKLTLKYSAAAGVALAVLLFAIPFQDRVSANVVVEAQMQQVITAPFEGFIAEVFVRPGDTVQQGQPLARFDDRDLRLDADKDRSDVALSEGKLRQAESDHDFATAQIVSAQLAQAQAQLALVQAKLARAVLTAPFDGTVISGDWRDQIGSPLETGKKMFEVAPNRGYRVVLHVLDNDISHVRTEQAGLIRLTAIPQQSLPFHVSRITSVASVQDNKNGFRVEARLDQDEPAIRPGMQGIGKIDVGRASLFSIWTRPLADWLRLKLWAFF